MATAHKFKGSKNSFLFVVLSCIGIMVQAQKPEFGIFGGAQTTSVKYRITGIKQPTQNKFGFHAGGTLKVPFESNLSFSPAIFYSLKGYKVNFNHYASPPDTAAIDNNTTIHTVELAFLLQYDFGKAPSHFFLRAGPSLDLQLTGKEKFNRKGGSPVSRNMIYSFADYGHYCGNLLFQLGFESAGGFMVFAQYTHGLVSLNNADYGPRIHYRAFGISVGKYFRNKKIILDTRNVE